MTPSARLQQPPSGDSNSSSAAIGDPLTPPPAPATSVAQSGPASVNGSGVKKTEHFPTRFSSWREFDGYLREFSAATYQVFRKRSSVTAAAHNRVLAELSHRRLPEGVEFASKYYHCTHGVARRSRGVGVRTHSAVRDTGCEATIRATAKVGHSVGDFYVQVRLAGAHNHPIGREQYLGYAEHRRITDPVLLRAIESMGARGEPPREILARLAAIMRETTGEERLFKYTDIQNTLARLKSEREQGEKGGMGDFDDTAEEQSSSGSEDAESGAAALRKKRARSTGDRSAAGDMDLHKKPKAGAKVRLARLRVLLDSSYCYNHVHNEITEIDIAALELPPGTISGIEHEIIQLSPAHRPDDVDFVLPRYALEGCESGIVEYCRRLGLPPQCVGVRLAVLEPGASSLSSVKRVVTLSSRQLLTMKRFYFVRRVVSDAERVLEWIASSANLEGCSLVAAPFDEYADYTADLFALSLRLMPLSSATVFGYFHAGGRDMASMQFADTVTGASLLQFGDPQSEIDVDCVKAALLSMHSRLNNRAAFLSPAFVLEELLSNSCVKGSTYGAFLAPKPFVAGVVRLQSKRWGGVVLDCAKNTCCLYASETGADFVELQREVKCLFAGYRLREVGFELTLLSASLTASWSAQLSGSSGILALLFVELKLLGMTWSDLSSSEPLDYFRLRYMLQAIQVVSTQNVHNIR